MPVMPFEGLQDETLEDTMETIPYWEPTHDEDDENYYSIFILSGEHDDRDEDMREFDSMIDFEPSTWESDRAADAWEKAFWQD